MSMNQFPVTVISETVSELKTEVDFGERQTRGGDMAAFDAWLGASPEAEPMPGDELPST